MNLNDKINQNRKEFDQVERANIEGIWAGIEANLAEDKRPSGWSLQIGSYWRWSIAALIVLSTGLLWLVPSSPERELPDLAEYYPQLKEQEQNYQRLIAQKETEMQLHELDVKKYPDLFMELELLDKIQAEYIKDIPAFKDNDQLINTLIRYYEQRIRILERLSNEIEKSKRHEHRAKEIAI